MVSSLKKKPITFDKAINIEYNFKSKLLFERRRLCGLRLRLSVCVCEKLFLLYGFGEQTSRILKFKPEGLEG